MTTINAGLMGKPVNDGGAEPLTFTFKPVDDGTNGNIGGQSTNVSKEQFNQAIIKVGISGGCPVDPANPSATGGVEKSDIPVDPNQDVSLTSEPGQHKSAIANMLASMSDKPVFKDASWVGGEKSDGGTTKVCIKDADTKMTVCTDQTGKGPPDAGTPKETTPGAGDYVKCVSGGGTIMTCSPLFNNNGKYVDAETSGSGHSLPDIDSMLSGGKSAPSGDTMGLGQFKSGSGYDFNAMKSSLENLFGIGTSSKGSSEQGGSTGVKTNTVSDGSSGGSSNDVKSAAPSSGGSVAPLTGLDALMQKFGMDCFSAHLKDGSFDLDNFSAGAPSAKGPILDLDGNGQQDIIEWALGQLVTEKADVAIVVEFHSNPALTEFHQLMMDKYADVFIA